MEKTSLGWKEFEESLCKRFGNKICKDIVEEFNKIQQNGSVEDYQEKFEKLKPLMLMKNPQLDEGYFVSSFISGLKEEIKPIIRMLKPTELSAAYEMVQLQEYSLQLQNKQEKELQKSLVENKFGMHKSQPPNTNSGNLYRIPPVSQHKFSSARKATPDNNSTRGFHHRKFRHQCKMGHLNFFIGDEEEDTEFEDAVGEQDEHTGNPRTVMEMSLHILSESLKRKTITITGQLDGEEVVILVDTGSSDSYINSELVIALDIPYRMVSPFSVIVRNGACVTSKAICPRVRWEVNQHKFGFDLKVMQLSGWHIMLGVDWMTHFSPITFDFHNLGISMKYQGEMVHLQGSSEDCELDLIRGKDLRHFIEYKKKYFAIRTMETDMASTSASKKTGEDQQPQEIRDLLEEFSVVIQQPVSLPPARACDHAIPLKPGAQPFKLKPYRYLHSQKNDIEKQVTMMFQHGIARNSNSPFASPVLLVKKNEGTWRFCVDCRKLNAITIKDCYPIPNVNELLNELVGSKYKSMLDWTAGYH
ncbi:uncharacterized protein [Coffea arabica]|uniref:Ty3 transposon capsid-like protein domain-containing protein n=1 Tax=Coffea arabica TaxID=13443 RepID=A0A6P6UEB8_COFAR